MHDKNATILFFFARLQKMACRYVNDNTLGSRTIIYQLTFG